MRTKCTTVLPVLLLASAGLAQTGERLWNNAGGGLWDTATNWSPQNVPDVPGEAAVIDLPGTYTVTIQSINPSIDYLIVANPGTTVALLGSRTLTLGGDLVNSGLLIVNANSSASATTLDFSWDAHLAGPGRVWLGQLGDRAQLTTSNGDTVTQSAGHRIEGAGHIRASLVNDGVVSSNIGTWTLGLLGSDKTNNGVMEAVNGGILEIDSIAVYQGAPGVLRADAGTIRVPGTMTAEVVAGTISTLNGGVMEVLGGGVLTLRDVTLDGQLDINGSGVVHSTGSTLVNQGLIRVNANNSASATVLDFASPVTLSDTGTIRMLQLGDRAQLTTSNGDTVTQSAGHRIEGAGHIRASLVNDGVVSSNIGTWTLGLLGSDKTNNGVMEAVNGGILEIDSIAVYQGAPGVLRADAGTIRVPGTMTAEVVAGTISTLNGGVMEVLGGGVLTLRDVTLDGQLDINGSGRVVAAGAGFANDGLIRVNSNGSASQTVLTFGETNAIQGTGTIQLLQVGARSTLTSDVGVTGTIGAGQRVTGRGALDGDLVLQGTLAPGLSIDTLTLAGSLSMSEIGNYEVEIASTGSYDRLAGAGAFTAGGILEVHTVDPYVPVFGHSYTIVQVGSVQGRFGAIAGPALPGAWQWRVRYEPTRAVLVVSCPADFTIDGVIDTRDVLSFLNAWTAQEPDADIDENGVIDTRDVLAYLNIWNVGC